MGTTTCSTVQIDSNPAASAAWAKAAAAAGSTIGPVLAKAIPKRMAADRTRHRVDALTGRRPGRIFRH